MNLAAFLRFAAIPGSWFRGNPILIAVWFGAALGVVADIDRPWLQAQTPPLSERLGPEPLAPQPDPRRTLVYPPTRAGEDRDDYHGTRIEDPFRWLEDVDSEETRAWVASQNALTFGYLSELPQREAIKSRLTKLWNYERYGLPRRFGDRYFFTHNDGLQNQNVLYTASRLDGERQELLDPNRLRADGTAALTDFVPNDEGTLLAYGIAQAGSDWTTWSVRDVATGQDRSDRIEWVKFSSVSWRKDGSGFFYSRYDAPTSQEFTGVNHYQKLYFHRLGTPQDQDVLVYQRMDEKEWGFRGSVTDDGRYLIVSVWRGTERKNQIFYAPLVPDSIPTQGDVVELLAGFEADFQFLGNDGEVFYFDTDLQAPRRRILAIDIRSPDRATWREVVSEGLESIERAALIGPRLWITYLHDATSVVRQFTVAGKRLRDLDIPDLGTVSGFQSKRDAKETFFSFTNYITPPRIYRLDLETDSVSVWKSPQVDFDSADYSTERIFYRSTDGTRIPMIVSQRRNLPVDGPKPTILYGYGGFNISVTPNFSPAHLVWMEMGGVYAVPNLRGGGEYGSEWHEAGMGDRKQNVFDDFIAAAEHLIEAGYTDSAHLAISGRSNGGLLVGAAMTQRPELFAVALPAVGVMDMLRFHKFTIGWAWVSEYGSSDDPLQFETLVRYSPLHRLQPGIRYPATLVTTADHDDRVVPGHSFKFAARLQHCQSGTRPALIRIETSAGHGAGTPVSKLIDAAADTLAFVWHHLPRE